MKTRIFALSLALSLPMIVWASHGPEPEQQMANAVMPNTSPTFKLMTSVTTLFSAPGASNPLARASGEKGLQFGEPVVDFGFLYRRSDYSGPGGFGGNEVGADMGVDADIYDGLVAGLIYQHLYRGAENDLGTSGHLDSDGVSFYCAKRFGIVNAGLTYNFAEIEHKLSRALIANLDRDSNGFTAILGLSDKHGRWNWSTTTAFGCAVEDYEQQRDIDTGRFTWGGSLSYDVTSVFTLGAAFNYHYFVFQDVFPGARTWDDDYWTLGPRFQFFPTENLTVELDFNTEEGFAGVSAYNARLGLSIAF
ncbi:MAG: hypothetical protein HY360_10025 [Verrucomicrobia bacterium]|nr:hypothetical protein [Verrucomicrobiota bacterium]